jgi:hypothetical protein
MVALLLVPLIVVAAFAVDFGAAYLNKRQLSTAADAAALAAARYYAAQTGTCHTFSDPTDANYATRYAAATALAQNYMDKNVNGATAQPLELSCGSDDSLLVTFRDTKSTPAGLGTLVGVGKVPTGRDATASVFVNLQGAALPYAMCVADAVIVRNNPTTVERGVYPGACGNFSGNWYTIDCPEDSGNTSQNNLAKACTTPIRIITTTPPDTDNAATELQLKNTCDGQPFTADPGCLRGNSGNITSNNLLDFWDSLVGTTVLLPVIYNNTVSTQGSGGGSTTHYPIAGFLGAKICGYHWGSHDSGTMSPDPACNGVNNSHNYSPSQAITGNGNQDNYLLLVYSSYVSSGTVGSTTCKLGDTSCDLGNHGAALVR